MHHICTLFAQPPDRGAARASEQRALVDSWSPAIANLLARYADLRIYELPTISPGNPLFRVWLDGAMRGGIPDRQAREHTITLYLDKAAFRQALDLPGHGRKSACRP